MVSCSIADVTDEQLHLFLCTDVIIMRSEEAKKKTTWFFAFYVYTRLEKSPGFLHLQFLHEAQFVDLKLKAPSDNVLADWERMINDNVNHVHHRKIKTSNKSKQQGSSQQQDSQEDLQPAELFQLAVNRNTFNSSKKVISEFVEIDADYGRFNAQDALFDKDVERLQAEIKRVCSVHNNPNVNTFFHVKSYKMNWTR